MANTQKRRVLTIRFVNYNTLVSEVCTSPIVDDESVSGTAKSIYKSGESICFACKTGYRLNTNVTTCLPTKIWFPPPVCNTVKCTVPVLTNGMYLNATDTGTWVSANESAYRYGSTLKVQCNEWYEITGMPNNLTCKHDGTWDLSPPQCVKGICNHSGGYVITITLCVLVFIDNHNSLQKPFILVQNNVHSYRNKTI